MIPNDSLPDVLIVDDEDVIADQLARCVVLAGLRVCATAGSATVATEAALLHRPGLVLMDVVLEGSGDGISAACAIREQVGCPVIFITGSEDPDVDTRIAAAGFLPALRKPVSMAVLKAVMLQALGLIVV